MNITIGISDMKVANDTSVTLVTYSLGSCIGLTLFDPVARVGGMLHFMLPLSKINPEKAKEAPLMFGDLAVPALIQGVLDLGGQKARLVAKAAGAASLFDDNKFFNIGERNYTVLRKVLWKNNILLAGEDCGGSVARTMYLEMATGATTIKFNGMNKAL